MSHLRRMREATEAVLALPDIRLRSNLDEATKAAVSQASSAVELATSPTIVRDPQNPDPSRVMKEALRALVDAPYFRNEDRNKWSQEKERAYDRAVHVFKTWFLAIDNEAEDLRKKKAQQRKKA